MPYCVSCGAKNPDDAHFCQSCGSRIVEEPSDAHVQRGSLEDEIPNSTAMIEANELSESAKSEVTKEMLTRVRALLNALGGEAAGALQPFSTAFKIEEWYRRRYWYEPDQKKTELLLRARASWVDYLNHGFGALAETDRGLRPEDAADLVAKYPALTKWLEDELVDLLLRSLLLNGWNFKKDEPRLHVLHTRLGTPRFERVMASLKDFTLVAAGADKGDAMSKKDIEYFWKTIAAELSRGEQPESVAMSEKVRPPHGWEYKDVKIYLNVSAKVPAGNFGQHAAARDGAIEAGYLASQRITPVLQGQARIGWEPDESVDLLSLFLAGRVAWRQTGGILLSWKFTYAHAMVRFKRWND